MLGLKLNYSKRGHRQHQAFTSALLDLKSIWSSWAQRAAPMKIFLITFSQRTANMSWRTCVVVKQIQSNQSNLFTKIPLNIVFLKWYKYSPGANELSICFLPYRWPDRFVKCWIHSTHIKYFFDNRHDRNKPTFFLSGLLSDAPGPPYVPGDDRCFSARLCFIYVAIALLCFRLAMLNILTKYRTVLKIRAICHARDL